MLQHVDNRGEVTLVTQDPGDQGGGGGQAQQEAERGHGEAGVTDALGPGPGILSLIAGTPWGSHSHTRGDIRTNGSNTSDIFLEDNVYCVV